MKQNTNDNSSNYKSVGIEVEIGIRIEIGIEIGIGMGGARLLSIFFVVCPRPINQVYVTTRPSARLMGNIRRLEDKLGYTFRYPWLCMQAITHPSWTMFDRVSGRKKRDLFFWTGGGGAPR